MIKIKLIKECSLFLFIIILFTGCFNKGSTNDNKDKNFIDNNKYYDDKDKDNDNKDNNEDDDNENDDIPKVPHNEVALGNAVTINGYQVVDGPDYPVNVTFKVNNIEKGEKAYKKLKANMPKLPKPGNGQEYIIITLSVSYNDGDLKNLDVYENFGTGIQYNRFFSIGDSKEFTDHLSDSIYNLAISKGETKQGSVAFLHDINSKEPLGFRGYYNTILFYLNS